MLAVSAEWPLLCNNDADEKSRKVTGARGVNNYRLDGTQWQNQGLIADITMNKAEYWRSVNFPDISAVIFIVFYRLLYNYACFAPDVRRRLFFLK